MTAEDAPAHLPARSTLGRVLLSPSSPGAAEGAGSRSEEGALSLQNAPAPGAAPPLLPATLLAARAGLLGGRRACLLLSHRGARSAALGLAAPPSQVPAGVAAAPSPSSPPRSSMSPVEARGCLAGPLRRASQGTYPPRIRLGCGCTPAPRPRSPRPGVGGRSGPSEPQAGLAAVSWCSRTVSGWGWGLARTCCGAASLLEPGPWATSPASCSSPAGATGQEGSPVPAAVTGAGGHPHVVGTGAGWGRSSGPGLCPQCLLGWWGRGGLGLRAAMVPSLWLWPSPSISTHDSHEARGPRGLCRWGGRKAAPRSQGARLSGWSSALCPARLPAVGHWSRSRLEAVAAPASAAQAEAADRSAGGLSPDWLGPWQPQARGEVEKGDLRGQT